MKSQNQYLMILIVVLVFAGTAYLMFSRLPEERIVSSDDGLITVEAVTQSDVVFEITSESRPEAQMAVLGKVYSVEPSDARLSQAATIRMRYTDEMLGELNPAQLVIGYFDTNVQAWRTLPTSLNRNARELSAETSHLSSWAILIDRNIEIPLAINDLIYRLISKPLYGATGYQVEIAYSIGEGDFILLPDKPASGGCGGVYRTGEIREFTSLEQVLEASVDGVVEAINFRVIATWEVGEGCLDGKELSASYR